MITKKITTEYGDVESSAEVLCSDIGQVTIHIVSKLGDATHEHRATIGAVDGNDGIARVAHCSVCGHSEEQKGVTELSEADLQAAIQKHLDDKRNEAAQVLAGRAKTARVTGKLI